MARDPAGQLPERFRVLGLAVDAVSMTDALGVVDRLVRSAEHPGYILAVNPEKVYAVRSNDFLREFFNHAALVVPDGIGIALALRLLFGRRVSRVPGADLMQRICQAAPQRGYRIFILGASEEVNAGAVQELQRRHPGIRIVGRANGFVGEAQMPALVRQINDSGTDILFIALGSPKQEEWLHRWLPELQVKVCQGIGGTLDTIVGRVKRAPAGWQRLGLEWLYRLVNQPSRIGRQRKLITFVCELAGVKLFGLNCAAGGYSPPPPVHRCLDWPWQVRWAMLVTYAGIVTWLSLAPAETFRGLPPFLLAQSKALHFLLYGVLVSLARWAMAAHWTVRPAFLVVVAGASAYGALMEMLQGALVRYHRTFEFSDIIANSLGALCFWWVSRWMFIRTPSPKVRPET